MQLDLWPVALFYSTYGYTMEQFKYWMSTKFDIFIIYNVKALNWFLTWQIYTTHYDQIFKFISEQKVDLRKLYVLQSWSGLVSAWDEPHHPISSKPMETFSHERNWRSCVYGNHSFTYRRELAIKMCKNRRYTHQTLVINITKTPWVIKPLTMRPMDHVPPA